MNFGISKKGEDFKKKVEEMEKEYPKLFKTKRFLRFNSNKIDLFIKNEFVDGTKDRYYEIHYLIHKEWLGLETKPLEPRVTRSKSNK